MEIAPIKNNYTNTNFGQLWLVPDAETKHLVWKMSRKQIQKLTEMKNKQADNVINGWIYASEDGKRFECRILSQYFIKGFKEYYYQIPIIESKIGFVKRFVKQLDKYKEQFANSIRTV